jgi:hypothetical protein
MKTAYGSDISTSVQLNRVAITSIITHTGTIAGGVTEQ